VEVRSLSKMTNGPSESIGNYTVTYHVSDKTARGWIVRNVHLTCNKAVVGWVIMLVALFVARSVGWDGISRCGVSGDLQLRRRSSLKREVVGELGRNKGGRKDVYRTIGPKVHLARRMKCSRRVVVERREMQLCKWAGHISITKIPQFIHGNTW